MTAPDVSKLSYNELRKLLEATEVAIEEKRDEELKVLADGYAKKVAAAGFTPQEAIDALKPYLPAKADKGATGAAKYRDPQTGDTWSGKGRPARWMQAHLDAGKKKEDFLSN